MLPNFIIIGAQKSGSTFLQNALSQHPEIYMPKGETPFFESHAYRNSSIKDLENLFKDIPKDKIIGIKRPEYLSCIECAKRIKKHLPNVKLIVVLRNPVDRAISAYFHYMKMGLLPIRNPNDGLIDILQNKHDPKYPRSKTVLENGLYYKYLKNYLKLFKRAQILIITLGEIKKNPKKIVRKIYKFLGVKETFVPKSPVILPQKGLYSITALKLRSLAYPLFFRYGKVKRGVIHNEHSLLKYPAALIFILAALINLVLPDDRKSIEKTTFTKLSKFYHEDTIKLTEIINSRKIKEWLKK